MKYTWISAAYGAPNQNSIIAQTQEAGAIMITAVDNPVEWADLFASNIEVADFPFPETIQEKQSRVWQQIQEERTRRWHGGVQVAGNWYHSDIHSRSQWTGMKLMGVPEGVQWKTMSGVFIPLTSLLVDQVIGAMALNDAAVFAVAESHRMAMMEEPDPYFYDFTSGWPPTFGE